MEEDSRDRFKQHDHPRSLQLIALPPFQAHQKPRALFNLQHLHSASYKYRPVLEPNTICDLPRPPEPLRNHAA
ncbi:hypothetical protein FIBSPDRAFT_879379, partial [Athelia psychrophila]